MAAQKERARSARSAEDNAGWLDESVMYHDLPATEFTGYESLAGEAKIIAIVKGMSSLDTASEGDEVRVVLDSTPFYGEGGGQTGDTGVMESDGFTAVVTNTTKTNGVYIHHVKITSGELAKGDTVTVCVDAQRRHAIARNHTATHLLQKALRMVLGDHVEQAGSLVTENELRFDFTHFEAISDEDLRTVEDIVNGEILKFTDVETKVLPIEEAKKLGAMMLFGEKYGDKVRVVDVPDFSLEFCGGTHVANIGQIGSMRIISESGVAAGVRRIEAITGSMVGIELAKQQELVSEVSGVLKTTPSALLKKAENLAEENRALKKELEELRKAGMNSGIADLLASAKEIIGARLITKTFENASIDDLRTLSDSIKSTEKGVVMVFASVNGEKATLMVSVTDDLVEKGYHAGNMIKQIAKAAGGGGGGKADMAQAGAKDISKLPDAFALAEKLMER
ncbi:MAG: alanine--tRNA ligase, partial [Firmicutes bacterium]|nr:alanine--tRNA ligase [Bacillota bacterium]